MPMCAVKEVKKKYVRMTELQEAQDQLSNGLTLVNSKVSIEELVWQLKLFKLEKIDLTSCLGCWIYEQLLHIEKQQSS